jgi:hypothetical protein
MTIENLSASQLRRAANIKDRIGALERELGKILGQASPQVADRQPRKKRRMSAAARARIAAAQRARWAKQKAAK